MIFVCDFAKFIVILIMDYAIYLGDADTVIYKRNEGIVLHEATRIAYTYAGRGGKEIRCVAVGGMAKKMQDRSDRKTMVEQVIGNGHIVDVELCKIFLRELLKKVCGEDYRGLKVLFCIPCSLNRAELENYKIVAHSIGIDVAEFVPTVIANAIGGGFNIEGSDVCLSVHIGEGGTEVAAISFASIIAGGSIYEGGAEATQEIAKYIDKKYKLDISERVSEITRNECGTLLMNDEVSYKVRGTCADSNAMREIWFNGIDGYKVVLPIYSKITKAILNVINDCGTEMMADVKAGNVYVGGEASTPTGLREFLTANLGMNIVMSAQSINYAINGAGILLSDKALLRKIIQGN